ncbi:PA14 domain-containing protein [Homoserinibacter gongjuensis]|uniref:PA14 domain-containing protein n=1 Tax=Homoserinibacter gongjuensis TaxID=1162968 RepID=A0ABQ6JQF2_9MICO|nr:PA14 domain-containing protein [Homoserinibacter gongjuensis]GMA90540.1 hypothetical protein GCM10025869_10690 [Homoserinibacter gongjuensis]
MQFSGRSLAVVGALVVAVMVVSVTPAEAIPDPQVPVPQEPNTGLSAMDIPPLESPDVFTPGSIEDPPASDAPLDNSAAKTATAIVGSDDPLKVDRDTARLTGREEYADLYVDASGQKFAEMSLAPKNVKDDKGHWVPLSETVTASADGSAQAKLHPLAPLFGKDAASKLLTVSRNGYTVSMSLEGASSSKRSAVEGDASNRVEYADALPGTDVTFEVDGATITEKLELTQVPAAAPEYRWQVTAPGLTATLNKFGDVELADEHGVVQVTIPAPVMWDSSGVDGKQGDAYANVSTTIEKAIDGVVLVLRPDFGWLTAKGRVYPVTVDPYITPGGQNFHAYNSNGATRSDGVLVGNSRIGGANTIWRTVLYYDYTSIITGSRQVIDGYLALGYGNDGTTNTTGGNVYHASCIGYSCTGPWLADYAVSTGTTYTDDQALPSKFAEFVNAGSGGAYLEITGNESAAYTYKFLYTTLVLYYNDLPSTPTQQLPASGTTAAPQRPIFKAAGTDPNGDSLGYFFTVYANSAGTGTPVWESGWVGAAVQIPQNQLNPVTQYWWRVKVRDGYWNRYGIQPVRQSGLWTFTTQSPSAPPLQPTATPADGSVVVTPTPTLSATANPAAEPGTLYQFRITTGADGVTGTVISSPWSSSLTWTVPAGVLLDGAAYTWRVVTDDGIDKWDSTWKNKLRIDQRIGASGPSPVDSAGPVSVNLANGNVSLGFSSPTISTLGGAIGQTFSYNSLLAKPTGLLARYYDATPLGGGDPVYDFTGKLPVLQRVDSAIDVNWDTGEPGPGVPTGKYLVRWDGYITLPAGTYAFGVKRGGGVRVNIEGTPGTWTQVVNQWVEGNSETALYVQPGELTVTVPATPVRISVEYYQGVDGKSSLSLYSKLGSGAYTAITAEQYMRVVESLPAGWGASTPLAGAAGAFANVQVTENAVTFTDVSGSVTTYTKNDKGTYMAPPGSTAR